MSKNKVLDEDEAPQSRYEKSAAFNPNAYVGMLYNEYKHVAFDEERAPQFLGRWRELAFVNLAGASQMPLDLEIGTGNGNHFAHLGAKHSDRLLVGLELKFKPLIQSIRRALKLGCKNVCITRFDANLLPKIFAPKEIDNIYIHHPDPWPRRRDWKHRLIQDQFLNELFEMQKSGCFVDFKTDSLEYFDWAEEKFLKSKYQIVRLTRDLHNSEWASENFITHFEKLFLRKSQPIFYCRLFHQ
jgi:tRNA (guanine-N7-)-methyltransferase